MFNIRFMLNRNGLFLLIFIFALTFTSANLGSYPINSCVNIKVLSNCSSVNLTFVDTNNDTFVINSAMQLLGGQTFNYSFCNTSYPGQYKYAWVESCVDCSGGLCGNDFWVNQNGAVINEANSLIYIIFFIGAIALFGLCLWGAIKLPWKNQRDEDERIIQINDLKYLKLFLIVITYIALLFLVGLSRSVFNNYLYATGVDSFFNWAYWILLSGLWPGVVLAIATAIIAFLQDKKWETAWERGVDIR